MGTERAVLREHDELDAVAGEWDALHAACGATPFQAHAWVSAWARAYVPAGRLRVAVVRSDGRLVAAAPLHLTRRGPWAVLSPLGGAITDVTDLLIADPTAGTALAATLLADPGWHVLDLPELRPGSAAHACAATWPGRVTRLPASSCLELPALPVPELLARLPGRTANTMRRKLRKVDAAGVAVRAVAPDEVPAAVDRLLALHEQQWAGRGGNPEHRTARFRAHLTVALPPMVAAGTSELVEYRLDGELVLAQILLLGPEDVAYYLAGIAPRLRERVDTAALLVRHDVELAVARGRTRYSMLRGQEDYKFRWRPDAVVQERLLLARPGPVAAGYPLVVRGRAAALDRARRHTPWLREVRDRVRRWRG